MRRLNLSELGVVKKLRYLYIKGIHSVNAKVLQAYTVYEGHGGVWEDVETVEQCGQVHDVPPCSVCGWGWDISQSASYHKE